MSYSFKRTYKFNDRYEESKRIMTLFPQKIPIICERSEFAPNGCPFIDKKKYLIPRDFTVGQFIYVIRNKLELPPEKALYLFICETIPASASYMDLIYEYYKDNDGFLYILYTFENTFG
jgi:GABA(A) receptor-associated protein